MHRLGRAEDVPAGRGRVYRVGGEEIAVFNVDGEFHAVENACARGLPLERATVVDDDVLCPWHGWRFDVQTGRCCMLPERSTRVFPLRVEGGDLLVELDGSLGRRATRGPRARVPRPEARPGSAPGS